MTLIKETVTEVTHWTDELFSFRTTRDPSIRFKSGQFTMIGLEVDGKPLLRAYSMVSSPYDDYMEFLSIKVQDGPLTSRLQFIEEGAIILVNTKTTGTLTLDNVLPGKRLFLLGTGTGLAPFMSIIRDYRVYEQFETVVLVHGVRYIRDLAYKDFLKTELQNDPYLGEQVKEQLVYWPTVTRDEYYSQGRITDHLKTWELNKDEDRVMVCGSPSVLKSTQELLEEKGFKESRRELGQYAIERAFVE